MSRPAWSQVARADLDEIWSFVAQDSIEAADRLIDRLVEAVAPLEDFPSIGVARDDLAAGLRALRVAAYIIFYRRRDADVRIERALNTRRYIISDDF